MSNFYILWLCISVVILVTPLSFIGIRQTVKFHRQEIVKDLSAVFQLPNQDKGVERNVFIPSFEFVKYKYFFERSGTSSLDDPKDFSVASWIIGIFPLIIVLCTISYGLAYLIICNLTILVIETSCHLICANFARVFLSEDQQIIFLYSVSSAVSAGYIFAIRSFFRAINNFDFGPTSYVGAANNIIAGLTLAIIFSVIFIFFSSAVGYNDKYTRYLAAIFGFVVGYFPEVVTRNIIFRSKFGNIKRENENVFKSMKITPIEIIDGIDSEIRDRLADHHIKSTQNLAAANPLMLFVETPYGVYQIMDWVAQAQLCCSVGPSKLTRLWQLGIRTLFDLERAALIEKYKNDDMLYAIGSILLEDDLLNNKYKNSSPEYSKLIISNIEIRLDDPHVHRLRQIYQKVGERIGPDSLRFTVKKENSDLHEEKI